MLVIESVALQGSIPIRTAIQKTFLPNKFKNVFTRFSEFQNEKTIAIHANRYLLLAKRFTSKRRKQY